MNAHINRHTTPAHFFLLSAFHPVQGYKFALGDRPQRTAARGCVPLTPEEAAAERARRAAAAANGDAAAAALPALFDD
jgi:hypothetical protein